MDRLNSFISEREKRFIDPKTIAWYRTYLEPWIRFQDDSPDMLTRVNRHLARYSRSTTRKTAWNAIKIFERWLAKRDGIVCWTDEIILKFDPQPEYPTLTEAEFERIMSELDFGRRAQYRDRVIYTMLFYTGARLDAIRLLKHGAVDLAEQSAYVLTKNKVQAPIHIPKPALRLLKEWIEAYPGKPSAYLFPSTHDQDRPICQSQISHNLIRLAKRAGIRKRVWVHGLRHSAITEMLDRDIPAEVVQRQALHRHISTTLRYNHMRRGRVRRAFDSAFQ